MAESNPKMEAISFNKPLRADFKQLFKALSNTTDARIWQRILSRANTSRPLDENERATISGGETPPKS